MTSQEHTRQERARVTFDLNPELVQPVHEAIGKGNARTFYNAAIAQYLRPAFHFFRPTPRRRAPLPDFLKDAQEIMMVGLTLASLHDRDEGSLTTFLRGKIEREQCPMTFMTLDPDLPDDDPVFQLLRDGYAGADPGGLRQALQQTHTVLADFVQVGKEAKVPIHVATYQAFPTCGVTISDPLTPKAKMRAVLYLAVSDREFHPFLEADSTSDEGTEACITMYRYYERLGQQRRPVRP